MVNKKRLIEIPSDGIVRIPIMSGADTVGEKVIDLSHIPTVDAIPLAAAELKYLINDTIAYIWRLEKRGCDKPEFGYDSRKALLEKLKQFYEEHFPEKNCPG